MNAERFVERLADAFLTIAEYPDTGFTRPVLPEGMKVFAVERYLVCFYRRDEWIEIVRVFHGAQALNRMFGVGTDDT